MKAPLSNPLEKDLQHILAKTHDLWQEMHGGRIFITGGTGFFGCWLLESLTYVNDSLNLGIQATVLTRNPAAFERKAPHLALHPCVNLFQGDVLKFDDPPGKYHYVIHAANDGEVIQRDPLLALDTITAGARRVLEFSVRAGVKKLLYTSSGAVYGKQPPDLLNTPETYTGAPDPLNPGSIYGEGKRTAELLCAAYARQHGLEAKIARCFAFTGPYLPLDGQFAVGNFVRDALQGGPIRVNGDGTPYRSYLYAADLAIWLWTILLRGESCRAYNVGSPEAISIFDLAHRVRQVLAPGAEVIVAQQATPGAPAPRYVPDIQRAQNELGLSAWVTMEESIQRMAAWATR
ncbi:MAG TPA: NAD-dependent epimerase/dehydratase family protein [Anaerolineaceae bacterium]